jgi:isopentenyl phosphate kinase
VIDLLSQIPSGEFWFRFPSRVTIRTESGEISFGPVLSGDMKPDGAKKVFRITSEDHISVKVSAFVTATVSSIEIGPDGVFASGETSVFRIDFRRKL